MTIQAENISSLQTGIAIDASNEKKKKTVMYSREEKASRNLTFMIFSIASLYVIGNTPNSLGFIILQFYSTNADFVKIVNIIANSTLFTSQSCDIFVYYNFNKQYKKILKKFLRFTK